MTHIGLLLIVASASSALPTFSIESGNVPSETHCKHQQPLLQDEHPFHVQLHREAESDNRGLRAKRSPDSNLRIKVFYHESVEKLNATKRDIIKKKVVPDAVSYWESVLKVRPNDATIRLHRKCENNQYFLADDDPTQFCKNQCVETKCGEFKVPEEHLSACHTCNSRGRSCGKKKDAGKGIDGADFVLYVSALPTPQCGESIGDEASTVAYAAHCQQEAELDRPIAGHTNICPAAVKRSDDEIASMTSTVKHELLHALGFSSSLFAYFRDAKGKPLTPRGSDGKPPINRQLQIRQWSDKVIRQETRPWVVRGGEVNRTFNILVTPNVVREVRRHFNCTKLQGAELEDQGGDGTALTHWEKRLFQNEAMTGTVHTQDPVYSRITFALLEDSGWYMPDYDKADNLTWGQNMGCDFALLSCKELMEKDNKKNTAANNSNTYPFCNTIMGISPKTSCTANKKSVGSCNLVKFASEIPRKYQNFDSVEGIEEKDMGKVGSSVTLADFCPYVQEFMWKSTKENSARGTRCTNPQNNPTKGNNYALESYGSGSRCFEQASKWEQRSCSMLKQWKRFGAGCYNYKCEDGMLHIVVRNVTLTCESEGQTLDIRLSQSGWLHEGSLRCPRCEDYCQKCKAGQKAKVDPNSLKEDIDNTCYEQGLNSLQDFLAGFGINLGR